MAAQCWFLIHTQLVACPDDFKIFVVRKTWLTSWSSKILLVLLVLLCARTTCASLHSVFIVVLGLQWTCDPSWAPTSSHLIFPPNSPIQFSILPYDPPIWSSHIIRHGQCPPSPASSHQGFVHGQAASAGPQLPSAPTLYFSYSNCVFLRLQLCISHTPIVYFSDIVIYISITCLLPSRLCPWPVGLWWLAGS